MLIEEILAYGQNGFLIIDLKFGWLFPVDHSIAWVIWTFYNSISWFRDVLTHCGLVMPYVDMCLVNIGLGNGLLPDGTKPLPEPMLTYHL